MAIALIDRPAEGSVAIDWSHPLAESLIGLWLLNEGAGLPTNLVPWQPPATQQASAASLPRWTVGQAGLGMNPELDHRVFDRLSGPTSTATATIAALFAEGFRPARPEARR